MKCPRRAEVGAIGEHPFRMPIDDQWREDQTCSWCGSLNPDVFMDRIEAGTAVLIPTDKNYKVYIENSGGEPFKQKYRDCYNQTPKGEQPACSGPDDCAHWVTREIDRTKFYFQHLSEEQQRRFATFLNDGKLGLKYPGEFYVLPFFIRRSKA